MYRSASILQWPTPKKIKIWTGYIKQNGTTDPPTVEVLHNSLNTEITLTRDGAGQYIGESSEHLPNAIFIMPNNNNGSTQVSCAQYLDDQHFLINQLSIVPPQIYFDGMNNILEIRSYHSQPISNL